MNRRRHMICLGASVLLALTVVANANEAQLQSELDALKTRIAELENTRQQTWLNERRAEEVKNLIREVLADAETRASLLENGMYAGHDGTTFFLKSADGGFLMNIAGQIQVRYIFNSRDNSGADDGEAGFTIRRTKIQFSGHIVDPRIKYAIQLAVSRRTNTVAADRIMIGYQLTNTVFVWAGEEKVMFLREENTSSKRQLAVERSYVNEFFTTDEALQGIGLKWDAHEQIRVNLALTDGLRIDASSIGVNPFTQSDDFGAQGEDRDRSKLFSEDASDIAVTGRVDLRLVGDWAQLKDFTAWPGEDLAVFLGAAVHYEKGETGDVFLNNDFVMWTVDGSVEYNGFNLFAAVMGMHTNNESTPALSTRDFDLLGVVVQGGYNFPVGHSSIEPFARWEYIDFDGAITGSGINTEDEVNMLTFGVNYYLTKHSAKFTVDLVWALDPVPISMTGQGLLADAFGEEDQVVLRSQFQLLF